MCTHNGFEKGQGIVFQLEDKLMIGVIDEVHSGEVWAIPLDPVELSCQEPSDKVQLWKYPDQLMLVSVPMENILPCFPSLELDKICSQHTKDGQSVMF